MMIGALMPALRIMPADLAAIGIGQADIEQNEIGVVFLGGLQALGAGRRLRGLELLVDRKLLGQRLPQALVIVDEKNALGGAHGAGSCRPDASLNIHGRPLNCRVTTKWIGCSVPDLSYQWSVILS